MGLTINQTEDPNTSSSRCAVIHAPPQLLLDGRNNFSSKISKAPICKYPFDPPPLKAKILNDSI